MIFKTFIIFLCISPFVFAQNTEVKIFKKEAQESFEYLNKFRNDPKLYGKEIGLELSEVRSSKALIWDETLAAQAEKKAIDMASNNYFSHIDKRGYGMNYYVNKAGFTLPDYWLTDKTGNQVESLGANSLGPDKFIQQLIIDKGVDDKGHRIHLLSMNEFYSKNSHVGIGIAYNPNSYYKYYFCILLAPKNGKNLMD